MVSNVPVVPEVYKMYSGSNALKCSMVSSLYMIVVSNDEYSYQIVLFVIYVNVFHQSFPIVVEASVHFGRSDFHVRSDFSLRIKC